LRVTSTDRPYDVEIFPQPKNLKKSPGITSKFNEAVSGGFSESYLLGDSVKFEERSTKALETAYKRCEYVTKLFSKVIDCFEIEFYQLHVYVYIF
jgi:hypothetical protein